MRQLYPGRHYGPRKDTQTNQQIEIKQKINLGGKLTLAPDQPNLPLFIYKLFSLSASLAHYQRHDCGIL